MQAFVLHFSECCYEYSWKESTLPHDKYNLLPRRHVSLRTFLFFTPGRNWESAWRCANTSNPGSCWLVAGRFPSSGSGREALMSPEKKAKGFEGWRGNGAWRGVAPARSHFREHTVNTVAGWCGLLSRGGFRLSITPGICGYNKQPTTYKHWTKRAVFDIESSAKDNSLPQEDIKVWIWMFICLMFFRPPLDTNIWNEWLVLMWTGTQCGSAKYFLRHWIRGCIWRWSPKLPKIIQNT